MKDITTKYVKGNLTIFWKPSLCIHSAICFKGLPTVFNPKIRPWVKPEFGTEEEIINQVKKCPSGALSYSFDNSINGSEKTETNNIKIEVSDGGPLLVNGKCIIVDKNGKETIVEGRTALCRCGQSKNKPFCDGQHKSTIFDK